MEIKDKIFLIKLGLIILIMQNISFSILWFYRNPFAKSAQFLFLLDIVGFRLLSFGFYSIQLFRDVGKGIFGWIIFRVSWQIGLIITGRPIENTIYDLMWFHTHYLFLNRITDGGSLLLFAILFLFGGLSLFLSGKSMQSVSPSSYYNSIYYYYTFVNLISVILISILWFTELPLFVGFFLKMEVLPIFGAITFFAVYQNKNVTSVNALADLENKRVEMYHKLGLSLN